jgi:hypothetical protein
MGAKKLGKYHVLNTLKINFCAQLNLEPQKAWAGKQGIQGSRIWIHNSGNLSRAGLPAMPTFNHAGFDFLCSLSSRSCRGFSDTSLPHSPNSA